MKQTKRGFTLIEFMIVIAIVAILTSIVMDAKTRREEVKPPAQQEVCLNGFKHIKQGGVAYQTVGENGGGVPCQ